MKNNWLDFRFIINNLLISENIIKISLNELYNTKLNLLNKEQFILIQFKIIDNKQICRSISYLQTIKLKEFHLLNEIFNEFWNVKS
jgi:hypothetical protein